MKPSKQKRTYGHPVHTFRAPRSLVRRFDKMCEERGFRGRSEGIRWVIGKALQIWENIDEDEQENPEGQE